MSFWRRFRREKKTTNQDEQVLVNLYNVVRKHGDGILLGETKLSLTTPVLILLNGTFQKLTEGVNQSCFQVANIIDGTNQGQLISFLFEFMQKVLSLKLISGPQSLDCPLLHLHYFKSLELLEIQKFPIIYLKNLHPLRKQLKSLICLRSTNSLKEVVCQFSKEDSVDPYILPSLTSLDLSYNTIEEIDNEALKLLPSLEVLNVSFNFIRCADSTTLPPLSHLNLGFNTIDSIPKLPSKLSQTLTKLVLRNNNLTSLEGLQALSSLVVLDLTSNCVVEFNELAPLAYLGKLLNLSLIENPISYNLNYTRSTIRKLSPVKRKGKITLDGRELEPAELRHLGQDVQPISLSSYIPEKPIGVPKVSVTHLVSSLPTLASSISTNISTPVHNERVKHKKPVRLAAILDHTSSSVVTGQYPDLSIETYTPIASSTSSFNGKEIKKSPNTCNMYSTRRSSLDESLIWVNATNGSVVKNDELGNKPRVDYDAWPAEETFDSFADGNSLTVNGVDREKSTSGCSEDMESDFHGNESTFSSSSIERENYSSGEEAVVISVISDDILDNDNGSCNSVPSMLTDCDETEFAYLVQNLKRSKNDRVHPIEECQHLFLICKPPYLLEKMDTGKLSNKLDLSYLKSVKIEDDNLTLILRFDLIRADWQYREYVFEQEDQLQSIVDIIQPIAVKNYQKKISEMKHCECLKCGHVFLKKEDSFELYCTECGSTMVIDKNEDDIHLSLDDSHCKNHFHSMSSIDQEEFDTLINESSAKDFMMPSMRRNINISSWPPSKNHEENKIHCMFGSLPAYLCECIDLQPPLGNSSGRQCSKRVCSVRKCRSNEAIKDEIIHSVYSKNDYSPFLKPFSMKQGFPLLGSSTISSSSCFSSGSADSIDSKNYPAFQRKSKSLPTSKKETLLSTINDYKKCDHRLKLFLSISVYQLEEEEFICQMRCWCGQYNKIAEYDCLLSISNRNIYIFSIVDPENDSPEECFRKEIVCPLKYLMSIKYGYFGQSFTFEFSKPGCYYKLLTRDSEKTNEFLDLLKVEFAELDIFQKEGPVFIDGETSQIITNIRKQVFGLSEELEEQGQRIYRQVSSYNSPPLLRTQKVRLRTHNQSFFAREFIDWLMKHREVKSRSEAIQLGETFLQMGMIYPISKDEKFRDNDGLFKFTLSNSNTKLTTTSSNGSESEHSNEDGDHMEEIDTSIKLYTLAHVKISESDSTFHPRSLLLTRSHIFLLNECHQWPLPTLHPPPPLLRDHFTVKDCHKIINVTSMQFYKDDLHYAKVCFVDEDDFSSSYETEWLIRSDSIRELHKLVDLVRYSWESLFAIELRVDTKPSVIPFLD